MSNVHLNFKDIVPLYEKSIDERGKFFKGINFNDLEKPIIKISANKFKYVGYSGLLGDYVIGLKNLINQFAIYIDRLNSWVEILKEYNEKTSQEIYYAIVLEFIRPIGSLAMQIPYALRSRFIFAAIKLNQEIEFHDWPPKAPNKTKVKEQDINHELMVAKCEHWKKFNNFNKKLEKIIGADFRKKTDNYRNRFNHQFPPEIEFGYTNTTKVTDLAGGTRSVSFGGDEPLKVDKIIDALNKSLQHGIQTYSSFVDFVNEMTNYINSK